MGRKSRERRHERQQRERAVYPPAAVIANETATPVLRLVRPEPTEIHGEPLPSGCASPAVDPIRDLERSQPDAAPEEGHDHVVAGTDSGPAADLVRRSFDPDEINAVLNDPHVLKMASIQGVDHIDAAPLLADERNYALVAEGGNILFLWHDLNIYEAHTSFLKPDRAKQSQNGPHIRNVCLAAYRWMFTRTDCTVLLTKIPHHNRAALIFSPLVGWTHEFTRKACWPTTDGELVDMTFSSLRYDDWIRKTPDLIRIGREFHDKLSAEFIRHGHEEKPHADEDCHDLHVGACAEMILARQLDKAVCLYNRWASFAGYEPMKLVSHTPAVLDIGSALLQVTGDGFKVILVR